MAPGEPVKCPIPSVAFLHSLLPGLGIHRQSRPLEKKDHCPLCLLNLASVVTMIGAVAVCVGQPLEGSNHLIRSLSHLRQSSKVDCHHKWVTMKPLPPQPLHSSRSRSSSNESTFHLLHLPVLRYAFRHAVKGSLSCTRGEETSMPHYVGLVKKLRFPAELARDDSLT